jgi:hypothetical protein
VIFKFEPNTMSYLRPDGGWSLVWGGTLTEAATGITVDDSSQFVYVSAYTNSEGTLSSAKYDMLVLKVNANTGILNWARRFGSTNNDKANGLTFYRGNLYVIGDSDSIGWTGVGARTDMVFLKLDPSTSQAIFANYLGGTAEDFGLKIVGHSDGFLYALGQGYSTEYTKGTIDPFIIRFDETGALDYMTSFGSSNPDYGSDMKVQGSLLVILGQSQSVELSQGFLDIFIAMANKDTLQTVWVRYIGTSSFDEIGKSLHILPDGTIWALGQIQANGFTNGNNDVLLMSLGVDGTTRFVQNMGASMSDLPAGMVYSQTNDKMNIFANTNSIFFMNQGGFDWLFFQLDKKGRN